MVNPVLKNKILDLSKIKLIAFLRQIKVESNNVTDLLDSKNIEGRGEILVTNIYPFPTIFLKGLIPSVFPNLHCLLKSKGPFSKSTGVIYMYMYRIIMIYT